MIILDGHYYDGRRPVAVPAKLEVAGSQALLTAGEVTRNYTVNELEVSPASGKADRFIALPDGGQLQVSDTPFLDLLSQSSPSERPVAWLEERWGIAAAGVAVIACILLVSYFYGLPAAAERIAGRIPVETERAVGRQALTWLDENGLFKPTNLDTTTQRNIKAGFDRLSSDLPLKDHYRLELRASKGLGANAFAFPGGTIVITDDMVKAADSPEEVLAVLAHEIGHVELRHAMRSVLQNSAVGVAVAAITSDAASLSVAVAGLPVMLAQTKYSREFEAAADEFAFDLLKRKNHSPAAFASLMERISGKHGRGERAFSYVSTHPVTEERVKRAREAAKK